MKYFFDCEFLEDGSTIDLISIAFVAEDGREYYAVNKDADWDRISYDKWLTENVTSQLPHYTEPEWKPKKQIAAEVLEFLLAGKGEVELYAWYGAYDHVAYAQLWGKMIDLPVGLPMFTYDVKAILERELPKGSKFLLPKQAEGVHDALADARHLKVRYEWIEERIKEEKSLVETLAKNLLESKRESMQELTYRLIEAKRDEMHIRAAQIEIEKFGLEREIQLLNYLLEG